MNVLHSFSSSHHELCNKRTRREQKHRNEYELLSYLSPLFLQYFSLKFSERERGDYLKDRKYSAVKKLLYLFLCSFNEFFLFISMTLFLAFSSLDVNNPFFFYPRNSIHVSHFLFEHSFLFKHISFIRSKNNFSSLSHLFISFFRRKSN